VDAIATDETDRAVVRAIVELARSLQLTTVAEGVEDADQALALADIGLTEVQGYFYARPMSPEQAADWLRTRPVGAPSR
jgi:EAL domain-containing protein (putative c-di-GMP-specific phosphodiesterase class I)